jgi:hypothetical protein
MGKQLRPISKVTDRAIRNSKDLYSLYCGYLWIRLNLTYALAIWPENR